MIFDDTREPQLLLYQVTVGDLTYLGSQQWSLTNNAVLLTAAIVAVGQSLSNLSGWEMGALVALELFVACTALFIPGTLQSSIIVRQARLDAVREKLGLEFYEAWAAKEKATEYLHAIAILRIAVVIAAVLAIWLLVRPTYT